MRNPRRAFAIAGLGALLATAAYGPVAIGDEVSGPGAWMGVRVEKISEGWRNHSGYRGAGLLVTEVEPQSPADGIGVVPGDILVAIGSMSLRFDEDVAIARSRLDPTVATPVVIARNGGQLIKIVNIEPIPQPSVEAPSETPDAVEETAEAPSVEEATSPSESASEPNLAPRAEEAKTESDAWKAFGVRCADLNEDLAVALGATVHRGALVIEVTTGGGAERVGIRAGDVITAVGVQTVSDARGLEDALKDASNNVSVKTVRQGSERRFDVSLEEPPVPGDESLEESEAAMRSEIQTLRREIEQLRAQMVARRHE